MYYCQWGYGMASSAWYGIPISMSRLSLNKLFYIASLIVRVSIRYIICEWGYDLLSSAWYTIDVSMSRLSLNKLFYIASLIASLDFAKVQTYGINAFLLYWLRLSFTLVLGWLSSSFFQICTCNMTSFILSLLAGISLKTQELYALVFATRYLDIFTDFISVYNTIMKLIFLASSFSIVWYMRQHKIVRRSYDKDQDTFRHHFLILPCLLLALFIHEKFTFKEVNLPIYL